MKNSIKKLIFVLAVMAMIATLAFALAACNNDAKTQTTPPTGGDTPSTGGDSTHVHAYGSWGITRSATCSVYGLKTRRCATCGNVDTQTIPKTAHTPVTDDAVEATCTQEGKTQGSHCGVCGTVIVAQTKVDKKEHTVVIDQAIPATCTEPGKTQGSHCEICKTVLQEQQETRALGHTAGAEWYSNDDTHWHECIRCHTHMDEVSHTYGNWQTQSTPTIDAEGIDRQYCTCGKYHERKVDKLPPFTFVMDGTVYSVKAYLGHDSVVEVPSTYNGVTVAMIGSYAFQYQTGITDIILPETILKIDYGAFSYCTSLQNVNIPKCMTFGDFAFDNCTALKEIVMPDNLTSCGKNMFNNCTALTKVTFTGGNVTGILSYNDTVQEIIVEDGVKSVARHAFTGCTSLKYLTLPRIESSATSFAEYYLGVTPQTYIYSYNGTDAYTDRDLIEPAAVDTYTMNGRVFGIPRSGCDWYVNSRYLGTVTNGGITYTYTDKPIKVSKWYNWYDISVGRSYNIPQTWTAEYSYLPKTPIEKLTVTNQMISRYDSVFDNCTCKLDIWQKFPIKQLSVTGNSSPFVDEFNEKDYTLVAEHTDNYIEKFPLFDYVDEDDRATAGELGQHQLTVTYQDASIEYALEILLHQFDDAVFNSHEFIFDGEAKYMSADMFTGLPEGTDVVFDGDGQSELGHYEVTATLSKQYYESKTLTATMDIFPPTFSLTYVLGIDEATHENPSDYQTNGDGVELAAATLAGFGFVDWYTEPEFTNKITKIDGNAHQDYTLYAKWQLPFDITDGSVKVNAFGKKQTEIVIPNRVYDRTITAIASEAFKGCTSLQAVTIGDGVTSIGVDAFKNCTGINKVNYLGTLKGWCEFLLDNASTNPMSAIGGAKLYLNDEEVTEVKDLDGLESIPAYAFYYCTGITSVTIPDSVTNIGVRAFYYCTGLQSLTIGKGVESIGDHSFYGCKGLSEITIPDSVQSIGSSAFSGCSNLKAISVDAGNAIYQSKDGVVYKSADKSIYIVPEAIEGEVAILDGCAKINAYAFDGCNGLTAVTIPDSVQNIDKYAFDGCTDLQTLTIGEGVQSIGDYAFRECTGLQTITLGQNVQSIGNYACSGCTGLQTVNWNATNCTKAGNSSSSIFSGCTKLTTVNIRENVQSIPNYAFQDCKGLAYITIPDSVQSIGDRAFYGCTGLQTLTLGEGVQSIGNSVFSGCTGLQTINWHATNCTKAGSYNDYIFKGCTQLATVNIGENVQSIPAYAFRNCKGLQTIVIGNVVQIIGESAFENCTGLQTVTLGTGVQSIGKDAFSNCGSKIEVNYLGTLKSWCEIEFGNSSSNPLTAKMYLNDVEVTEIKDLDGIESISSFAFAGLKGITSVTIPDSVTSIGRSAFEDCTGLQTATINAQSIGESAFYECTGLRSVTIGEGVQSIGDDAFYGCTGLQTINWNATNCTVAGSNNYPIFKECTQLTTVNIGENVQSIPSYAFCDCLAITKVNVTSLKKWCEIKYYDRYASPLYLANNAKLYLNDVEVTDIKELDGLKSINDYAFYGLSNLTSVIIPNSVQIIGNNAFYGCSKLVHIRNLSGVEISSPAEIDGEVVTTADAEFQNKLEKDDNGIWTYTVGETIYAIRYDGSDTNLDLSINNKINAIYPYAFYKHADITSVTIPDGVQSIGDSAFYGCTGLKEIALPDSVQSIGEYAFSHCTGITTATMPANAINHIPQDSLKTVTITSGIINYRAFSDCTGLRTVTIAEGVTSIGGYAFYGCTGLSEITIPDGVQSIGYSAFYGCTGLHTVTIPDSVTSIDDNAFYGCTYLRSVIIGKGVTSIGSYAFEGCTYLRSVIIGKGVTSIGSYAFYGCTGLKDIYYVGDDWQWRNIEKGYNWNTYYSSYYDNTYTINYTMHYNSTGPEVASNIFALPSDQPVLIACDKLDLWVKQD